MYVEILIRRCEKERQNEIFDKENNIHAFKIDQSARRKIDDTRKMENEAHKNNQDDDSSFELAANRRNITLQER